MRNAGRLSEAETTSAETTVREEEGAERRRQMAASGQRQADQTEASAAYLRTDESCRARIRGRHVSAAGALFFPIAPTQVGGKKEGEKRETEGAPPPLSPLIIEGRERGALSLSASRLAMLHCLNSHFLYKIDALTAALEHTHPPW